MSDEVSDFLRSVELLKERREEEDEARSRDLEEKILQEKRERQARRAGIANPIRSHFIQPSIPARAFLHLALENQERRASPTGIAMRKSCQDAQ